VRVVFYKTETARGFVKAVEAHDEAFDAAAFAEEFVDLLFGCVEGEVADVEGCGVLEFVHWVWGGGAVGGVAALALVLLVVVSEGERIVGGGGCLPLLLRRRRGGPVFRLCWPCGIAAWL